MTAIRILGEFLWHSRSPLQIETAVLQHPSMYGHPILVQLGKTLGNRTFPNTPLEGDTLCHIH